MDDGTLVHPTNGETISDEPMKNEVPFQARDYTLPDQLMTHDALPDHTTNNKTILDRQTEIDFRDQLTITNTGNGETNAGTTKTSLTTSNEAAPEQQWETVRKLKERVSDVLAPERQTDVYLKKWLIARNFDLDKAEEMLRKHIIFMKANSLDEIDENFVPNEVLEYFHTVNLGYDAEGSVVRILHIGASDLRGLVLSTSKLDTMRMAVHLIISDIKKQKRDRENKPMTEKQVYIFDLQGLSWTTVLNRAVAERAYVLLKCYESNFPENLKKVYLLNAPSFFNFIYNWLKTVLPMSILSKVEVVSSENWKAVLTKHIDPKILPAAYGGNRTDGDGNPNCLSLYKRPWNTPVPEQYLLTSQSGALDALAADPNSKSATIFAGSSLVLELSADEPGATLRWDFATTPADIAFGLKYLGPLGSQGQPQTLVPLHRVESHRVTESGKWTCDHPGVYEILFDNNYSWMTKKDVIYKVSVSPPEEEKVDC